MEAQGGAAPVGVIGGSGLYRFLDSAEPVEVDTPFGPPSAPLSMAIAGGRSVAFLPRHGARHTIPPHRINYRANAWAMRAMGVSRVIGPCAVGSLRAPLRPGDAVVCDQVIDLTRGREGTFFDEGDVAHLSAADPYCPELRPRAVAAARAAGFAAHDGGTGVVIPGPRFNTRAESRAQRAMGGDVVGMTQCPEVMLLRELGICYVNISLVTDYDAGLDGVPEAHPVTQEEVFAVFGRNIERLRDALVRLIAVVPEARGCACGSAPAPLHS